MGYSDCACLTVSFFVSIGCSYLCLFFLKPSLFIKSIINDQDRNINNTLIPMWQFILMLAFSIYTCFFCLSVYEDQLEFLIAFYLTTIFHIYWLMHGFVLAWIFLASLERWVFFNLRDKNTDLRMSLINMNSLKLLLDVISVGLGVSFKRLRSSDRFSVEYSCSNYMMLRWFGNNEFYSYVIVKLIEKECLHSWPSKHIDTISELIDYINKQEKMTANPEPADIPVDYIDDDNLFSAPKSMD